MPELITALMNDPLIPDVSVIIPARNRPELLRRALRCVEDQVGVAVEVIVIDDASEPPLEGALGEGTWRNVRFVRNLVRCNAACSRNRGARLARADVFAFLDSDDMWFPAHLQRALDCLAKEAQNVLYVSRFGSEEIVSSEQPSLYKDGYRFLFERIGDPRSSALVVRKAFFEEVQGFDQHLEKYQDWDFALRCSHKGELLLDESTTAYLDELAADRMSSRTDIVAARAFLARHAQRMSDRHLSRFFATLLIASATHNEAKEHRKALGLWREHLSLRSFPARYWALLCCRRMGLFLTKGWLSLRRWRQSASGRISS